MRITYYRWHQRGWLRAQLVATVCAAALSGCATLGGGAGGHIEAGDRAFQAHRYDEAAAHYEAAERDPAHRGAAARKWMAMAEFFERTGHDTGRQYAHRYYKRAIAADPQLPGPRLARARMLLAMPDWQRRDLDPDRVLGFLEEEERLAPGRAEVADLKADALRLRDQKSENDRRHAKAVANAGRGWRARPAPGPAKHAPAQVDPQEQNVGELICALVAFRVWGAPDPSAPSGSITATRIRCRNPTGAAARLKADDVSLIGSGGEQSGADESSDNFGLVFDAPPPQFVERFVDVPPGADADLGFTFSASGDRTDARGLVLDVAGTKFRRTVSGE